MLRHLCERDAAPRGAAAQPCQIRVRLRQPHPVHLAEALLKGHLAALRRRRRQLRLAARRRRLRAAAAAAVGHGGAAQQRVLWSGVRLLEGFGVNMAARREGSGRARRPNRCPSGRGGWQLTRAGSGCVPSGLGLGREGNEKPPPSPELILTDLQACLEQQGSQNARDWSYK